MSKLLDAVEAHITSRKVPPQGMIVNVAHKAHGLHDVWSVAVRLGQEVALPETYSREAMDKVLYDVRVGIADFVYGEYVPELRAVTTHLYEVGDIESAQRISSIINDMRGCK